MKPLRMGLNIAIACLAGGFALVAGKLPHHNPVPVFYGS
jgi:hypothetical protein